MRPMQQWLTVGALFVVLASAITASPLLNAQQTEWIGMPAPAVDLSGAINSDVSSLEELEGQIVILEFWTTW